MSRDIPLYTLAGVPADAQIRPYAAALPELPDPRPTVYAIPGNHDWYDGLTLPQGLAQVGLGSAAFTGCAALPAVWAPWAAVALVPLVAGFLASELTAVYLLVAGLGGPNLNELFAAQSLQDHKGLVRLHIRPDGELRVMIESAQGPR